MKFLCVPCDSPMKLQSVGPPDRGSLAVVYACPDCGYEMAMLTNAYETQVVQSLGVKIGPSTPVGSPVSLGTSPSTPVGSPVSLGTGPSTPVGPPVSLGTSPSTPVGSPVSLGADLASSSTSAAGRCPFSAMIPGDATRDVTPAGGPVAVRWTAAAESRLE